MLAGFWTVAFTVAVMAAGCNRQTGSSSTSSTDQNEIRLDALRQLRPVSLPDFSHMTELVQDQIREQYSSVMQQLENPDTTVVELGNAYGELGKLLLAVDYFDASEASFLNAQALVPNDMRWPYYLAHVHRFKGALATSAAFFEQAQRLQSHHLATLIWLGEVHLAQGRFEAAEHQFIRALSLRASPVAARFGLGRAAMGRQDYAGAVKHLEEALKLDPMAVAIHYPLAMAYRRLGRTGDADAHLRMRAGTKVLFDDPLMRELDELLESPGNYELRGTRALDQGDWAAAAGQFRKGIELAPADPSLRHRLGTALFMLGDEAGALEQFQAAVRASPTFARAHYSLGVLMESSGRHEEAVTRFLAAVKYDPSYVEPRLSLAGVWQRTGRLQAALDQYEQILTIDPRAMEARFKYAMALARLRRYPEARDQLNRGLTAHPDQPQFAHALARVLAAAPNDLVRDGRRAQAIMQALSDEQKRLDLGETMAMTLAELGEYEQAAAWQRGAMAAAKQLGRDQLVHRMAENLYMYEREKPCRTPWRDGEWP